MATVVPRSYTVERTFDTILQTLYPDYTFTGDELAAARRQFLGRFSPIYDKAVAKYPGKGLPHGVRDPKNQKYREWKDVKDFNTFASGVGEYATGAWTGDEKLFKDDFQAWWKSYQPERSGDPAVLKYKDLDYADTMIKVNAPKSQPTGYAATSVPGTYIPGLGTVSATGQLGRGLTQNLGGGELDTRVGTNRQGDFIQQGSASVDTSTKSIRPHLYIAGGESVRPDDEANLQSDALFEAFSWVPDGHGLGPSNALHLQNKQNEHLRFGMNPLSLPRTEADYAHPRMMRTQFWERMEDRQILDLVATDIGQEYLQEMGVKAQEKTPIHVLDNDYNAFHSSKLLKRRTPVPLETVVDNQDPYMPAYDPAPAVMQHGGYQDNLSATFKRRKMNLLNRIQISG